MAEISFTDNQQNRIKLTGLYIPAPNKAKKWLNQNWATFITPDKKAPPSIKDSYGTVIIAPDASPPSLLSLALLAEGLAIIDPNPNYPEIDSAYWQAEALARAEKKNYWANDIIHADQVHKTYGFIIAQGKIDNIHDGRNVTFINFSPEWRGHFRLLIENRNWQDWPEMHRLDQGQEIEVRGWLEPYYGPIIKINHATQIRLVGDGK